MVLPVVLYSIIANIHRLFMISTSCIESGFGYEMDSDLSLSEPSLFCEEGEMLIITISELRLTIY